jgi:hypothetical protein
LAGFAGLVILGFIIYKTTRNSNTINRNKENPGFTIEPFISQSPPNTNPLGVDVDDTGTTATTTTTTNRDIKYMPVHNRMISVDTSLVSATDRGSRSSSHGRVPTSQATSSSSRSRPSYSKLSGQVRRPGTQIQSPQQTSLSPPENVGSNAEVDTTITAEIDALKREVQGLREAQQEMLGIVNPPEYNADPPEVVRVTLL